MASATDFPLLPVRWTAAPGSDITEIQVADADTAANGEVATQPEPECLKKYRWQAKLLEEKCGNAAAENSAAAPADGAAPVDANPPPAQSSAESPAGGAEQGWVDPDAAPTGASADRPRQGNIILTGPVPAVNGPKRAVAVGSFDAVGAFTAYYGGWDLGGGLAAMLVSALVESDRFIVVERANISQVLTEQELKAAGATKAATGPDAGKLTAVQLLIYGAVTEFGSEDRGSGFSVGVTTGLLGNLLSGALSRQTASGAVAMDIRLVDTTSGEILENHRVREEVSSTGWDVSAGYEGISLGTNEFYSTPLGEASRRAITRAVQFIARKAQDTPWLGRVVDFDGTELYINAGARSGMRVGDQFMIERVVKRLTDPTTGEVLSIRMQPLGVVRLTGVERKISYGTYSPIEPTDPERGDLVNIMR